MKPAESQRVFWEDSFTHWELEFLRLHTKFLELRDTKNRSSAMNFVKINQETNRNTAAVYSPAIAFCRRSGVPRM